MISAAEAIFARVERLPAPDGEPMFSPSALARLRSLARPSSDMHAAAGVPSFLADPLVPAIPGTTRNAPAYVPADRPLCPECGGTIPLSGVICPRCQAATCGADCSSTHDEWCAENAAVRAERGARLNRLAPAYRRIFAIQARGAEIFGVPRNVGDAILDTLEECQAIDRAQGTRAALALAEKHRAEWNAIPGLEGLADIKALKRLHERHTHEILTAIEGGAL